MTAECGHAASSSAEPPRAPASPSQPERESRQSGALPPPSRSARLTGVDATRGIALLGMIAVHTLWAYDDEGDITWHYALAAGRSAAIFAVLAGVGIAFMTRRRRVPPGERRAVAASLAVRAGMIAVIGLALGYTDADLATVILAYYAVLFLLAIPLVCLPTRAVALIGATAAMVLPVASHLVRPALPEPADGNVSFAQLFQDPVRLLLQLTVTGLYPALPWMAYICLGLVIGRMRLSSPRVAIGLLGGGSAAAGAAWGLSWLLLGPLGGERQLYAAAAESGTSTRVVDDILTWGASGTTPTETGWWLATVAPHTTTPLDLLHTGGVAAALLGAMLLLARIAEPVLVPVAAAGGMTLTLYTAHLLFLNAPLDLLTPESAYVFQVLAAVGFALAWRAAVGRGPLEALVTVAASGAGRRAVAHDQAPG